MECIYSLKTWRAREFDPDECFCEWMRLCGLVTIRFIILSMVKDTKCIHRIWMVR